MGYLQKSNNDNKKLSFEEKIYTGDFSGFSQTEQVQFLKQLCEHLGLNPLTKPFEFIYMNEKTVMYAKKDATDQLRDKKSISIEIVGKETVNECFIVTAKAILPNGRIDTSTGAVSLTKAEQAWDDKSKRYKKTGKIVPLTGDDYANALMKAETKAKRRVTLSVCGLGILDESELETVKNITALGTHKVKDKEEPKQLPPEAIEKVDFYLGEMTRANDFEELKKAYMEAAKYAQLEIKNRIVYQSFIDAKDKKKAELEAAMKTPEMDKFLEEYEDA